MSISSVRVMLLGWDAADWKVIRPLLAAGEMPHLAGLMARGVQGNHATIYPPLSPCLWTSIATGKRPAKHGVLGFSEPTADGRGIRPCSVLSRKTKALWNILAQEGKRSLVVGWWPSFPAEPIPGAMVANHFQRVPDDPEAPLPPLLPGVVAPARLTEALAELRVRPAEIPGEMLRLFVPRFEGVDQEHDKSLHDLAKILAETLSVHAAATELLEREPWDFAAVYFDAIDHASHRFMQYYPPRQEGVPEREFGLYREVVANVYRYHDAMLGRYLQLAGPDTHVLVVSDHGFHSDARRPRWIPVEPAGPAVEHRHFGICVMAGPGLLRGEQIFGSSILDVTPTILTLFGLPVGADMDGTPQIQAWQQPPQVRHIPSWDSVPGEAGRHPPDTHQDPRAAAAALEQMIALGYVAPLPDEVTEGVRETTRELDYNLARGLADAGQPREAAPILERLWEEWPAEHRFGFHLTDVLARLGWAAPRREALRKLRDRGEQFAAEAKAKLSAWPQEPAVDAIAQQQPEARRRVYERRMYVERAQGLGPQMVREEVIQALLEGDRARAAAELAPLLDGRELPPLLGGFVAATLVDLGRGDEALPILEAQLKVEPEDPGLEALRAEVYYRKEDWQAVVDAASGALGLVYFNPRLHLLLGLALVQLGHTSDGTNELLVAVKQNPAQLPAWQALARLFRHDPEAGRKYRFMRDALKNNLVRQRRELNSSRLRPASVPASYDFTVWCQEPASAPGSLGPDEIVVVSGLPRSGTSMLMRVIEAGGIPVLADDHRPADESNRHGYFELAAVKDTARDAAWTRQAKGKVVKVVVPLLRYLPRELPLRVVVLHRPLPSLLASQEAMKARLGTSARAGEEGALARHFAATMRQLPDLFRGRPQWHTLHVSYEMMLADPAGQCARLAGFLGSSFQARGAAAAVDPSQRRF